MSAVSPSRPPLLVIAGPTASGKSELAVALAHALGGEVLNFDSRQVYRGLDVGSAKPTAREREGVPHHLFDLVEPEETFSAARFRAEALARAAEVTARGRLPILVGGTGLYLRVLERGLFEGPARDERNHVRLTQIADAGGLPRLRSWLLRVDPESAARIGTGDRQRVLRALDVYLQSGRPMSAHLREAKPAELPFRLLKLAPEWPREQLYRRIGARAEAMLASGFLEEVQRLDLRPGFSASNAAKAVGVRPLLAHLGGRLTLAEAAAVLVADTRRLAKRQLTWFRHEPELRWIPATDEAGAFVSALAHVRRWLFGLPIEIDLRVMS